MRIVFDAVDRVVVLGGRLSGDDLADLIGVGAHGVEVRVLDGLEGRGLVLPDGRAGLEDIVLCVEQLEGEGPVAQVGVGGLLCLEDGLALRGVLVVELGCGELGLAVVGDLEGAVAGVLDLDGHGLDVRIVFDAVDRVVVLGGRLSGDDLADLIGVGAHGVEVRVLDGLEGRGLVLSDGRAGLEDIIRCVEQLEGEGPVAQVGVGGLLGRELGLAFRVVGVGNGETRLRFAVRDHRGGELARGTVSFNHNLYRILNVRICDAVLLDTLGCRVVIFRDDLFDGVVIRSGLLEGDRPEDSGGRCARGTCILSATRGHGCLHAGIICSGCELEVKGCDVLWPHVD